jgi:hypothetical protein
MHEISQRGFHLFRDPIARLNVPLQRRAGIVRQILGRDWKVTTERVLACTMTATNTRISNDTVTAARSGPASLVSLLKLTGLHLTKKEHGLISTDASIIGTNQHCLGEVERLVSVIL